MEISWVEKVWQTDTQTDRQTDRRTDGQTDTPTDEQTDKRTDKRTDRQTHGQTDKQAGGQTMHSYTTFHIHILIKYLSYYTSNINSQICLWVVLHPYSVISHNYINSYKLVNPYILELHSKSYYSCITIIIYYNWPNLFTNRHVYIFQKKVL